MRYVKILKNAKLVELVCDVTARPSAPVRRVDCKAIKYVTADTAGKAEKRKSAAEEK